MNDRFEVKVRRVILDTEVCCCEEMSCFSVDSEGKRIKSDILVSGWIRDIRKKYGLLIPKDVNNICFEYWLFKLCDEWETKYLLPYIQVKDECVRITKRKIGDDLPSIYGCHSISEGVYEWKIRFNTKVKWICIGIIEDEEKILEKYADNNDYEQSNGGFLLSMNGIIYAFDERIHGYCKTFEKRGTIITMKLDMDQCVLSYAINGKDYGTALENIPKKRYRFVVNLLYYGEEIELL